MNECDVEELHSAAIKQFVDYVTQEQTWTFEEGGADCGHQWSDGFISGKYRLSRHGDRYLLSSNGVRLQWAEESWYSSQKTVRANWLSSAYRMLYEKYIEKKKCQDLLRALR